jgi:glycosyltransferase involved in cell wall biosynthesis
MASSSTPPEFSVIIPARNEAALIERALDSIASQACAPGSLEAVVVANGCVDDTAERARRFARGQPGLCVQVLEEQQPGLARAKNLGVRAARGQWLVFLDADSCFGPGLIAAIRELVAAGCSAGSIPVAADSRDLLDRGFFGLMEFGKRLFDIQAQMFFCPRDAFLAAGGFDKSMRLGEDRDFLQRLQKQGLRFGRVRGACILTSTRRLHRLPLRLGIPVTFARWALANWGIGRRWRY